MAYATPEQLATALRIQVTPTNTELLTACLEAAAEEIDADLDRDADHVLPVPPPAMVNRVNVNRAVEWYKASDANAGQIGTDQTGELAIPFDGFQRYSVTLRPLKQRWGVG
jgi:hypothetical protein